MRRAQDWFRQAELDLAVARHNQGGGYHDWACFAAQQAAEKALKGCLLTRNERSRSSSVVELLRGFGELPGEVLDAGKALDKHYMLARYPNCHPAGAPADLYMSSEAQRAISDAERIIAYVRRRL